LIKTVRPAPSPLTLLSPPFSSSQVYLHGGAPNKNIGDAFLLVWKFPDGVDDAALASALAAERAASADGRADDADPAVPPGAELDARLALAKARRLADQALASFVVVQAALRRSARLAELCARPDVQARLPGFQLRMGFGLHVGWAIEGAIGSEYKVWKRRRREKGRRA
jgi:class 3 adenylate cyclase